jgi:hypothetical protein
MAKTLFEKAWTRNYQLVHCPSRNKEEALKTINKLQSSKERIIDTSWGTCRDKNY